MQKNIRLFDEKADHSGIQREKRITLVEVLDRALNKGIVISGDLVISVADIDLIYLGVKVLLSSVETMEGMREAPAEARTQETT